MFAGQPRYWEIVHNKNFEKVRIDKEKIVQIKKQNNNVSFLNI